MPYKLASVVESDPKATVSIPTTPRSKGGVLLLSLDCSTLPFYPYLIMLSAKQGGINYHFLSLWYDPTWD